MTLGMPGLDQKRFRIGIVVLAAGVVLILWSWGNWVYRNAKQGQGPEVVRVQDADPNRPKANPIAVAPQLLLYTMIIVLTVLFGSYVLVRAARRYQEAAARPPIAPSQVQNAWEMHKTPEYDRSENGDLR